jgi:protein gp138
MPDSREPSWPAALDVVLTSRLRGVHTSMMGSIRSYSEAKQTAEVMLAVHLETADGVFEELPPLADVPVAWPGAWEAGDSCLLVFCEESFAKWFDTGSVEPPEVLRRHGLHAVCIPLVARAGQDVQFIALEPGVAAVLGDFVDGVKTLAAALVPSTGVNAAAQTAFATLATAIKLRITEHEMAATKVKAR